MRALKCTTYKCAAQCAEIATKLVEHMASEDLRGKSLTLKLKGSNFEVCSATLRV